MDQLLQDELAAELAEPRLHHWLKPELIEAATARTVIRLPVKPELARDAEGRQVHGGILAALADLAAYTASRAARFPAPATTGMSIEYLRPAEGPFLLARGTPRRVGRRRAVIDVDIEDSGGRLVAVARVGFATVRPKA